MKTYMAELHRHDAGHNNRNGFVARLCIEADNRGRAVHQAQLWYWAKYRGALGPAHRVLVVNDPYEEVRYSITFNCGSKTNRLLDEATTVRVLQEAGGELTRDERPDNPHNPPGSVRRVKRRRDFGRFIASNIRQMRNGVLYYRVTRVPQKTRNGRRLRKRKCYDVRLEARTVLDALDEIERRMLPAQHQHDPSRDTRTRSIVFVRERLFATQSATPT